MKKKLHSHFFSTDSLLKVVVPKSIQTEENEIKVEVAGKSSIFSELFLVEHPVINMISPKEILPGEVLSIKGKGISSISALVIDGNPYTAELVNDSLATFLLPHDVLPGKKNLTFTMFGKLIQTDKTFDVVLPKIVSINPEIAWLDDILTVKGTYLDKLSNFQIGGIGLQEITKCDSMVTLRVNEIFSSSTLSARFFYNNDIESEVPVKLNMPVITSIEPSVAYAGDKITLKGERFFYGMSSSIGTLQNIAINQAQLTLPWNLPAGSQTVDLIYGPDISYGTVSFSVPEIKILDYYPKQIKRGDTGKCGG